MGGVQHPGRVAALAKGVIRNLEPSRLWDKAQPFLLFEDRSALANRGCTRR
jgi:hypothetical protein